MNKKLLSGIGGAVVAITLAVVTTFAQTDGQINSVNNSNVQGNYRLEAADSRTSVTVNLGGMQANTRHAGQIRQGTCSNIGTAVLPLNPITADSQGNGTMNAVVDAPLTTIQNGNHVIVYLETDSTQSQPIACGAIPAAQGQSPTMTPSPTSGQGTTTTDDTTTTPSAPTTGFGGSQR